MEPYENLRKGRIVIRARKGELPDLKALLGLMETEIGFAPVTEVTLDGTGRLVREQGELRLDLEVGRTLVVASPVETADGMPPENVDLVIAAAATDPRSSDRVVLRRWKRKAETKPGS